MEGWSFAVALLASILLFEFALFRYFGSVGTANARSAGSDDRAEAASIGGGRVPEGGNSAASDGDAVPCPTCGTRNSDVPTVVFCHECLGRIQ